MEQDKDKNNFNSFAQLIDSFVKCVYDDFGKPKIARGVLIGFDDEFIYIKGDYSKQTINRSKITSLTSQIKGSDG